MGEGALEIKGFFKKTGSRQTLVPSCRPVCGKVRASPSTNLRHTDPTSFVLTNRPFAVFPMSGT
jgi:hypothetical protein